MSFDQLMDLSVTLASRDLEHFHQAPSSVTVFSGREIRQMGIRTVEALLNYVPGMQSTRDATRSVYGLATRGRFAMEQSIDVLFLINGRRLNDDFSGTALVFERFLTTNDLKQVEVIRGPGSVLYGANAFMGVVNIVTDPDLDDAFVGGGSHHALEGYLNLSGDLGGYHGSLSVSGLRDHGQGFTDPSDPKGQEIHDPRRHLEVYATLADRRLRLDARYAEFTLDDFYLFGTIPAAHDNHYYSSDAYVDLSYRLIDDSNGTLVAKAGYRRIHHHSLVRTLTEQQMTPFLAAGLIDTLDAFWAGPKVDQSEYHLDLDGTFQLNPRQRLFAGVQYRSTRFDALRNRNNYELADLVDAALGDVHPIRYYGGIAETSDFGPTGSSRDNLGLYLQDKIHLGRGWDATLGLRYDHYSDSGRTFSPRAALVFSPLPAETFKLLYGGAFRAPTIVETAIRLSPSIIGNPDLKPEKVRTLELAWLHDFGPAHITLTGYRSRIEDLIVGAALGDGSGRFHRVNRGTQDLSGLEFELISELGPQWLLRATYSHLFQVVEHPRMVARDLASVVLNYHRGPWNLNLNGFYHGAVEPAVPGAIPGTKIEEVVDLNLNARYAWNRGLVLVAGVYNLLDDTSGRITRSPIPGGGPARGREYRLGLEYDF